VVQYCCVHVVVHRSTGLRVSTSSRRHWLSNDRSRRWCRCRSCGRCRRRHSATSRQHVWVACCWNVALMLRLLQHVTGCRLTIPLRYGNRIRPLTCVKQSITIFLEDAQSERTTIITVTIPDASWLHLKTWHHVDRHTCHICSDRMPCLQLILQLPRHSALTIIPNSSTNLPIFNQLFSIPFCNFGQAFCTPYQHGGALLEPGIDKTFIVFWRSARLGFYWSDLPSFDDLCTQADQNLFNKVLHFT